MVKLAIRLVLVLIVAAGAVGGGAYWWKTGRFQESTDNAYVEGDISVISPLIEGKVATVAVGDNQAVKTGDVLVTIEDDDFRAKVAEAEASRAAAEASNRHHRQPDHLAADQDRPDRRAAAQRRRGADPREDSL